MALAVAAAGCASGSVTRAAVTEPNGADTAAPSALLLFVGDVMLGRGVGPVAAADPEGLFAGVRSTIRNADVAFLNLESPLTTLPHIVANPNDLRADPALAEAVVGAGFDVANLANNHAGDAGPEGLAETVEALAVAGAAALGGAPDQSAIHVIEVNGLTIGSTAFTMTGSEGMSSSGTLWSEPEAERIVRDLAAVSDVVVVSLHGGSEVIPVADKAISHIAEHLAEWGADVVWGHGPHVPHPVLTLDQSGGNAAVIATSLGNFLFDQHFAPTQTGLILEVIVDAEGVVAYRVGEADHRDLVVGAPVWRLPKGDAVLFGTEWWTPTMPPTPDPTRPAETSSFAFGDVVAAAWGDVTGDGADDLVVAYRHPFRETPLNRLYPDRVWADAAGRSAHLGLFTPTGDPIWGAGTLADPIDVIAPCDGAVGVVYGSFDGAVVGTGALRWQGFGLFDVPVLPGAGFPGCADIDGDGTREVVISSRRPSVIGP
jgi:poly-gamma-glutamate synthesis protein (capsule biosynthesis protein)